MQTLNRLIDETQLEQSSQRSSLRPLELIIGKHTGGCCSGCGPCKLLGTVLRWENDPRHTITQVLFQAQPLYVGVLLGGM